jgi:hypothetical protein
MWIGKGVNLVFADPHVYAERYQLSQEQTEHRMLVTLPQEVLTDWQVQKGKLRFIFDRIGKLSTTGSRRMTAAIDIISSSLAMEVSSDTNDPTPEVYVTQRREEEPLESSTTTPTAIAPMSSTLSELTPMCDPWGELIRERVDLEQ